MANGKRQVSRNFLARDYDDWRGELTRYAKTLLPNEVVDLSEVGVSGMLIDLVSYVADNMSYYLDHQFVELDPELAVEDTNIERHLRQAGVEITGATHAHVTLTFACEVDAKQVNGAYEPDPDQLPIVQAGTAVEADNGVRFELVEDVDFNARRSDGRLEAEVVVGRVDQTTTTPLTFVVKARGLAVSGESTTESFTIPTTFVPFRTITLGNANVTAIDSVVDSEGNVYHEVASLTHDVVYRRVKRADDEYYIELLPAPYRFVRSTSLSLRLTTLRFGSGRSDEVDVESVPDPSDIALPLFGKRTFTHRPLDPNRLLRSRSMGIAPVGTTLRVSYRYGGGTHHNVPAGTIRTITALNTKFQPGASPATAARVRSSIRVTNEVAAVGGEDAPTIDELRARIPIAKASQSRVVSVDDLVARVYEMPSDFGRVFRAATRVNEVDATSVLLYVVSRDGQGKLTTTPDATKLNIVRYLNELRLVGDAIQIVDAPVVNFAVEFRVVLADVANQSLTVQAVNRALIRYFDITKWSIDKPISIDDVRNVIYNVEGVVGISSLMFMNRVGTIGGRRYSDYHHDMTPQDGVYIAPPPGGIFEVRYPDVDVKGGVA